MTQKKRKNPGAAQVEGEFSTLVAEIMLSIWIGFFLSLLPLLLYCQIFHPDGLYGAALMFGKWIWYRIDSFIDEASLLRDSSFGIAMYIYLIHEYKLE